MTRDRSDTHTRVSLGQVDELALTRLAECFLSLSYPLFFSRSHTRVQVDESALTILAESLHPRVYQAQILTKKNS
jgi:hypothetical protein